MEAKSDELDFEPGFEDFSWMRDVNKLTPTQREELRREIEEARERGAFVENLPCIYDRVFVSAEPVLISEKNSRLPDRSTKHEPF